MVAVFLVVWHTFSGWQDKKFLNIRHWKLKETCYKPKNFCFLDGGYFYF